mmetsp:Transcript_17746/g.49150  ORF Transcript_17746/g.49150 Transcript_17746/m.49150 type:complete len:290 (-) Transcript_17746:500-1369(-)
MRKMPGTNGSTRASTTFRKEPTLKSWPGHGHKRRRNTTASSWITSCNNDARRPVANNSSATTATTTTPICGRATTTTTIFIPSQTNLGPTNSFIPLLLPTLPMPMPTTRLTPRWITCNKAWNSFARETSGRPSFPSRRNSSSETWTTPPPGECWASATPRTIRIRKPSGASKPRWTRIPFVPKHCWHSASVTSTNSGTKRRSKTSGPGSPTIPNTRDWNSRCPTQRNRNCERNCEREPRRRTFTAPLRTQRSIRTTTTTTTTTATTLPRATGTVAQPNHRHSTRSRACC